MKPKGGRQRQLQRGVVPAPQLEPGDIGGLVNRITIPDRAGAAAVGAIGDCQPGRSAGACLGGQAREREKDSSAAPSANWQLVR